MQPAVDKVGGNIHEAGPFHRVGTDQGHLIYTEHIDEFGYRKAGMADFYGVTNWQSFDSLEGCLTDDLPIATPRQDCCRVGSTWQHGEKCLQSFRIKSKV